MVTLMFHIEVLLLLIIMSSPARFHQYLEHWNSNPKSAGLIPGLGAHFLRDVWPFVYHR